MNISAAGVFTSIILTSHHIVSYRLVIFNSVVYQSFFYNLIHSSVVVKRCIYSLLPDDVSSLWIKLVSARRSMVSSVTV